MMLPRAAMPWLCAALIACATGPRPRSSEADASAPRPNPPLAPVIDTDADGIPDERDACPSEAEDKDGFEDTDGCPDLDNDHDRNVDAEDKCPNEPETYNGIDDDDGCPDPNPPGFVGPRPLHAFPKIFFARGRAVIEARSLPILDEVAAAIKEHCAVIEGRAHASVEERRPEALATARAKAVRAALIARGVPPEKVRLSSAGTTKPLCLEETESCRVHNRSVELLPADSPPCR